MDTLVDFVPKDRIEVGAIVALKSGGSNNLVIGIDGPNITTACVQPNGELVYTTLKRWVYQVIAERPTFDEETMQWSNCL